MNVKNKEEKNDKVIMPKIIGLDIEKARKVLKKYDLKIKKDNYNKKDIIKKQIPEEGIKIEKNKEIIVEIK